jgi:quercetin dioxygenase-like cupin family protein
MEEASYIPLLSELTARLSAAPSDNPPNIILTGYGGAPDMIGRSLYKTDEVAIMQVFLPKGNVLAEHRHGQREWLICFHGKIKFESRGEVQIMTPGSCRFMEIGQSHKSVALEDSRTIVVTIPADPGFPDV